MNCTNKEQETAECEKRGCNGCAFNEKTADEMFAELGYKQNFDGNGNIEFYKYESSLCIDDTLYLIRFYAKDKEVCKNGIITMQELQAINKKVQELGWKG